MTFLFVASQFWRECCRLRHRSRIRRLPPHGRSPFRSCLRLVLKLSGLHLVSCPPFNSRFRTGDLHPTSSRPCRAYQFISVSACRRLQGDLLTRPDCSSRPGRIGDCSTNPPTDPDVRISLIRFLGTARFHTARMLLDAASRIIRLRPRTEALGYPLVFTVTCSPSCPNHVRSEGAEARTPIADAGTSASPASSARHGDLASSATLV